MKIEISEEEIRQAIVDYIGHLGINLRNKEIDVDMATTRNPKGYSATIEILPQKKEPSQDTEEEQSTPDTGSIFGEGSE